MKEKETPQEQAARLNAWLKQECEENMPEGEERVYMLMICEQQKNNKSGEIIYCSNVPRKAMLDWMEEFMMRNRPARGKGVKK